MPDQQDAEDKSIRATIQRAYEEVTAYFEELNGESERAAAVLAVAKLENELEALLRSKFPPDLSNTVWKSIAGPGPTPFGTLKAKLDVLLAFRFFGSRTRSAIDQIASVRNKFAHRPNVRSFDHPDILKNCRELTNNPIHPFTLIENPKSSDIRWLYLTTVKVLTNRIEAIRYYIPELDGEPPEPLP